MTQDEAATIVREVDSNLKHAHGVLLDRLISSLLTPVELGWKDARVEAPPLRLRVFVVQSYDDVGLAALDEALDADGWARWTVYGPHNTYEMTLQIRWWMPVPLPPRGR